MASVKFEKGSREWIMFQDYWKLCQMFWEPEDDEGYWEQLKAAAIEFRKRNGDTNAARHLAMALIHSMDEKSKKGGRQ